MSSVGEILRETRESQKRTLAEVAGELCITQRYLTAIEENDIDSLPGAFFYRSFVRQYATLLGIDPDRVQASLDQQSGENQPLLQTQAVAYSDPIVESTNRLHWIGQGWRPAAALVAAVVVCSGIYAWWTQLPAAVSGSVAVARSAPAAAVSKAVVNSPAQTVIADVVRPPSDPTSVVLHLSATQTTWLSIRSGGKEIFQGILRPGEPATTVSGQQLATMKIGNAGGVDIVLNGKPIPVLGSSGQVMQVRFTPQDFKILRPTPDEDDEPSGAPAKLLSDQRL